MPDASTPPTVWALGHSDRTLPGLVAVLRAHGITRLVDIRRFPGSRRFPHFSSGILAAGMQAAGIDYRHAEDLGGHREPRPDSPHTAWTEDGFRGYADHMQTPRFRAALEDLLDEASRQRTAILCAERSWEQCHRALLCDRLKSQGVRVLHVVDDAPPGEHPWTPKARLVNGRLSYAAPVQGDLFGDTAP